MRDKLSEHRFLLNQIEECNPVADFYENGAHYIRRDLVTDDGNIDYKKLLEETKPENSNCYPANHEVKCCLLYTSPSPRD